MLPLLFTLLVVGCSSNHPDEAAKPVATKAPEPPKPKEDLDGARAALAKGEAAGALKLAEAWLAKHPEDDATWDFLELAALRANDAAGLVDRLSADQAIGGRADRHHALRGSLALLAKRPADALVAARALAAVAPGDAAALIAGAVKLGAPVPEGVDPTVSLLLAAQADPKAAVDPAVDALPGWRVALVRAELKLARNDLAGAAAEAAKTPAGLPHLLALPLVLQTAADPDAAWSAAEAVAREAAKAQDAAGAAQALDLGLPFAISAWKSEAAAKVAGELRKVADEAKNPDGAGALAAVEAQADLRAGHPLAAKAAATAAAATAGAKAAGSWELVLADAALGDAPGVTAAAAGLAEPEATAARELAATLRGAQKLPGSGLTGDDAALVAMLSAGWLDDPSEALRVAAASPAADLHTWAVAWSGPGALPAGEGAAWAEESGARAWLATGKGAALTGDHPETAAWNAVIGAEAGAPGGGVAPWARARMALAAADVVTAAHEYEALAEAVPAWRTGPWSPVLTLDGPRPDEMGADAEKVRAAADAVTPAVALHGWAQSRATTTMMWHGGVAPLPPGTSAELSAAVWDAAAAHRVAELAWLVGEGAWPTAPRDALVAAEKAAGLVAAPSVDVSALRAGLDGSAVLSFRPLPGMVEVLYLTANGGKLVRVKPQTGDAMVTWTKAVIAGDAAVAQGDRLRSAILDSAEETLAGIGKFYVVGPPPYGSFAINALPEQSDGLRFLADIRSVAYYPDFGSIIEANPPVPEDYQQTLVALCATPVESDMIKRLYPGAMVLEGPTATVAAFKTNAGAARFLHIGDFPTGPTGGWQLADGELSVAEVAAMPLSARAAYVGGGADPVGAQRRLAAVRRAGVKDFLVGAPGANPTFHERAVTHFWEGVNRRYSATRSFYESRAATMKEFDLGNRPTNWVRYMIAGKP